MKTLTIIKLDGIKGFDDGEKFNCCSTFQEIAERIRDEYPACKISFREKNKYGGWERLSSEEREEFLSYLVRKGPCAVEVDLS